MMEAFVALRQFIEIFLVVFAIIAGIAASISIQRAIIRSLVETFASIEVTIEKKESYEEAMSHYDSGEAAELDLSSGITLDDLLQSDGEIPDKYLGRQ